MTLFFIFCTAIFALIILIFAGKLYYYDSTTIINNNKYVNELQAQLSETKKEFKKKRISEEEFNTTKFEINKRILKEIRYEKSKISKMEKAPAIFSNISIYLGLPFLIISTSIIYLEIGSYGFEDQPQKSIILGKETPTASRLNQKQAELFLSQTLNETPITQQKNENQQLKILVERLENILIDRPKDLKGYNLLVDNAARLGDYKTSYLGQKHIIETIKSTVTAEDYSKLAELMIGATNGYISIEAEENIKKSLYVNLSNQRARYYHGLLKLQNGKLDEGYAIWQELLREGPEDAPWNQLIRQDIIRLNKMLSEKTRQFENHLPKALDQDTLEMINDMVSALNERLKTKGGTYKDWLKLVRSYRVLGKEEQAFESLERAKRYFRDQPDVLKKLQRLTP